MRVLVILESTPLSNMWFALDLSLFVHCSNSAFCRAEYFDFSEVVCQFKILWLCFLVSCVRTLCIALVMKIFSYKSDFAFRPVVHFQLMFACGFMFRAKVICFCTWMSKCFNTIYWKDYSFSVELCLHFCQNQLVVFVWVCFWTLCSVPLIYKPIPLPVPQCLHHYSFVVIL